MMLAASNVDYGRYGELSPSGVRTVSAVRSMKDRGNLFHSFSSSCSERHIPPSSHHSTMNEDKSWKNSEQKKRGDRFEEHVRRMFPDSDFKIILASEGRGSKIPDFYIKYEPRGLKFWVEAKYRRAVDDDGKVKIFGDRPDRLNLLLAFQGIVLPETVFVILGLGRDPDSPRDLFRIPVVEIKFASCYRDKLENWRCSSSFTKYENFTLD
jgi:hypothetical protein